VTTRLFARDGAPVVVRAWQGRDGAVTLRAEDAPAGEGDRGCAEGPAERDRLEWAIERMRFMLGLDLDLTEFHTRFRADPLIGPALRRRPWARPLRNSTPWGHWPGPSPPS
jgi:hypothetical protein